MTKVRVSLSNITTLGYSLYWATSHFPLIPCLKYSSKDFEKSKDGKIILLQPFLENCFRFNTNWIKTIVSIKTSQLRCSVEQVIGFFMVTS